MVKEDIIDFGTVKQGESIELSWDLTIDGNEIVHFAPDCGCTANIRFDPATNQIKALYTEDDAKALNDKQKREWYPTGKLPITKGITVYLKDDQNLISFTDAKTTQFNPNKKQHRIGFVGYCEFNAPAGAEMPAPVQEG